MSEDGVMTLTGFLLARIAEDEAAARAALYDDKGLSPYGNRRPRIDDGRWSVGSPEERYGERVEGIGIMIYDEGGHNAAQAAHIARWDPARVLAECEAKRRIVEIHREVPASDIDWSDCALCPTGLTRTRWPCPTLRALALPYADHPDYREGRRP